MIRVFNMLVIILRMLLLKLINNKTLYKNSKWISKKKMPLNKPNNKNQLVQNKTQVSK